MSFEYRLPDDLNQYNQMYQNIEKFKADFYQTLYECSNIALRRYSSSYENPGYYCLIKLSGPLVGIISAVTTIAARVSVIVEIILKGSINMIQMTFDPKTSFPKEFLLLSCRLAGQFCRLPFSIIAAIGGIFSKTLNMAFNTERYPYDKWQEHNQNLRKYEQRERFINGFQSIVNMISSNV